MEIPRKKYNDNEIVEQLANEMLNELKCNNFRYAGLDLMSKYGKETLSKVLNRFKEKGYYCYYLLRFDGVWIGIQVYNYDYQPSNGGLNKLVKY